MCFGPSTLGARTKTHTRIRNNEVYATLYVQALRVVPPSYRDLSYLMYLQAVLVVPPSYHGLSYLMYLQAVRVGNVQVLDMLLGNGARITTTGN